MTDLTKMWTELERYQPYAEKHAFGDVWRRMTTERTEAAARDAARDAAWVAARAAAWAVRAAGTEWNVAIASRHAIKNIREAIKLEEKA